MSRVRIGKVLEQMGKLSGHDIDEILHEQMCGGPKKSFGEIALTWGLCQPEHIWKAWAHQLSNGFEKIDLKAVGIDSQAACMLPRELATRVCAVGVRFIDGELVIAVSDPAHIAVFENLQDLLPGMKFSFVLADAAQIREMIERSYSDPLAA